MVTNCSAEHSFSQLKYIKNPIRTTMQQGRLDALSLLSIEADVFCKINSEDLIRDYAIKKKVRENFSNLNKVVLYKNKHYFQSYCKFCFILKNKTLLRFTHVHILNYIYIYWGTKIV